MKRRQRGRRQSKSAPRQEGRTVATVDGPSGTDSVAGDPPVPFSCPECWQPILGSQEIAMLSCGHCYHRECADHILGCAALSQISRNGNDRRRHGGSPNDGTDEEVLCGACGRRVTLRNLYLAVDNTQGDEQEAVVKHWTPAHEGIIALQEDFREARNRAIELSAETQKLHYRCAAFHRQREILRAEAKLMASGAQLDGIDVEEVLETVRQKRSITRFDAATNTIVVGVDEEGTKVGGGGSGGAVGVGDPISLWRLEEDLSKMNDRGVWRHLRLLTVRERETHRQVLDLRAKRDHLRQELATLSLQKRSLQQEAAQRNRVLGNTRGRTHCQQSADHHEQPQEEGAREGSSLLRRREPSQLPLRSPARQPTCSQRKRARSDSPPQVPVQTPQRRCGVEEIHSVIDVDDEEENVLSSSSSVCIIENPRPQRPVIRPLAQQQEDPFAEEDEGELAPEGCSGRGSLLVREPPQLIGGSRTLLRHQIDSRVELQRRNLLSARDLPNPAAGRFQVDITDKRFRMRPP